MTVVAAHEQKITLRVVECYPAHEPRENDPHYRHFNSARARLKRLGKLTCWINNHDCCGAIELHHTTVEFALANGVDVARFEELYPEFAIRSDEEFLTWIEGPENLTPLCLFHHRGAGGVHVLPAPLWTPQRFWKEGLNAPGRCERDQG